jgi:8-oxo-dGTP diphosphatase
MAKIICYDFDGNEHEVKESEVVFRAGAYGLYFLNDSVVLTNDEGTDKWDVPGGGLEKRETDEEALRREFLEETGMTIEGKVTFFTRVHGYFFAGEGKAWDSQQTYFIVNKVSGELQNTIDKFGTAEARWVKMSDLDSYNIKPETLKIIEKAYETIKQESD